MSIWQKKKIGFVLTDGFREADVIGLQAVLGVHPRNKIYYISKDMQPVMGNCGMQLIPNLRFEDCKDMDLIIFGETSDAMAQNNRYLEFVKSAYENSKQVLAISNSVLTLGQLGLLKNKKVTSHDSHKEALIAQGVDYVTNQNVVMDGKLISCGPSTSAILAAFKINEEMRGSLITKLMELNLEFDPQPKFQTKLEDLTKVENVNLEGLKVGVMMPPNLYVPDIMGAVYVFSQLPNSEIYYVWDEVQETQAILGPKLINNMTFKQCPDLDVILVGALMPSACDHKELLNFLKTQSENAKAIVGVCAGSNILGAAGLLEGKNATSNFHMIDILSAVKALPTHKAIVQDGKVYTAGPAIGSYEIAIDVVSKLYGDDYAQYVEQNLLEFGSESLFNMGSPEKANKFLVWLSKTLFSPAASYYKKKSRKAFHAA